MTLSYETPGFGAKINFWLLLGSRSGSGKLWRLWEADLKDLEDLQDLEDLEDLQDL